MTSGLKDKWTLAQAVFNTCILGQGQGGLYYYWIIGQKDTSGSGHKTSTNGPQYD